MGTVAPPRPAPSRPSAPAAPRRRRSEPSKGPTTTVDPVALWIRLGVFVLLAAYAASYWASFVSDPPTGRIFLVLLTAVALGAALIGVGRLPLPRWAIHSIAFGLMLFALGFALVRMGLPADLLKPAHWDDFGTLIDRGLSGLRTVSWPYDGDEPVVKLVVLLAIPPALVVAAALSFWPVKAPPGLEAIGLVILVALYGVAITDQDFGGELGRGFLLLLMIAAWLWLPRLDQRTGLAAAAAVAAAGLLALPVAAALDANKPWVDYESWGIGGKPTASERFDWNHRYGPINWPRSGRTLLMVRSQEPHYWKAETLDHFDGLRWSHSRRNDRIQPGTEFPPELNTNWLERISFTVRELRSELVIGAGSITSVNGDGLGVRTASPDGSIRLIERPLEEGDTYDISAYVPDPDAAQMRAAQDSWMEALKTYTTFSLPNPGENALNVPPVSSRGFERREFGGEREVGLPFRGVPWTDEDRAIESEIEGSPYGQMYRLARRLADGQPTTYDIVRATERYLQRNLEYSERVPTRAYPLPAFIFQDKLGYCQHFSGAMALMLRMNGIPARVAGGFAPGIYESSTREHRVRDLDAHSWVEVYFAGIGWVPFDPTPTTSPAGSQSGATDAASAARGGLADRATTLRESREDGGTTAAGAADGAAEEDGLGLWLLPLALFGFALAGLAALVAYSLIHERRHQRAHPADSQLAELCSALDRLGQKVPPKTTLSALERRLSRFVGPGAARYARLLRERRYGPPGSGGPGRNDRVALRRELGAAAGRLGRLRALLALPPRRRAAR